MSWTITLTLVGSIVVVSAAVANTPPPPPVPTGHKVVDPLVRFVGIDGQKDYVFYLVVNTSARLIQEEVNDAKPIKLDFKSNGVNPRIINISLLAVNRADFAKRVKEDPSLKWLTSSASGGLSAKLNPPPTTAPVDVKNPPVTTYRVTLKDGKLQVDIVEDKKSSEGPAADLLPIWAFGIVSSLSIAWLGIWFARRGPTRGQSQGGQR